MAKFNKGDLSEGILAAAITARFLSKTKTISDRDVISIINKLKKAVGGSKGQTSTTSFQSANRETSIKDTVICKVNLAEINMKAFQTASTYNNKDIKDIVKASVGYANGPHIREWADMMYENNQKNKIEVLSEGLLDQTGTKVDLKIKIDGVQAGVGISLKYGDVKQFGQVGGTTWGAMKTLFSPLGIKLEKTHETKYVKLVSEKKIADALTLIYKEAHKQLSSKSRPVMMKNLAKFMEYHATSNEKDVVLVQLNKREAKVYDFTQLSSKLTGYDFDIKLTYGVTDKLSSGGYKGSKKIPKLSFVAGGEDLVYIRVKMEGNRVNSKGKRLPLTVRSYVEKGKLTTQLIT